MVTNPPSLRAAWFTISMLGVIGTPFVTTEIASAAAVRWTFEDVFVERISCTFSPSPGRNLCSPDPGPVLLIGFFEYDAEKNQYLNFDFAVSTPSQTENLRVDCNLIPIYGNAFCLYRPVNSTNQTFNTTWALTGPGGRVRSSTSFTFAAPLTNSPSPQRIPVTQAFLSYDIRLATGFPSDYSYLGLSSGFVVSQGTQPEPQPIPESSVPLGIFVSTALFWLTNKTENRELEG